MIPEYEGLKFERLGHASVKISGKDSPVIYIDPWSEVMSDSPGDADYVIVTHDDFDHYDPEAIEKVANQETKIIMYEEIDGSELNRSYESIDVDELREFAGFSVETLPAYNLEDGEHVDEEGSPYHSVGEVIGVKLDINGKNILFTSDTDYLDVHDGLDVDVLIPPIGGHYTMDRHQAADLAESLQPGLVLPVHYDTFEPIETDEENFKEELEEKGIKTILF